MLIVRLAWVMMTNWVSRLKSLRRRLNRSLFASSRAASTSSRKQKGVGLVLNTANCRAKAVMDFSPPLSREMLRVSFPGGLATTSIPASKTSTPASSRISALPPPKSFLKIF